MSSAEAGAGYRMPRSECYAAMVIGVLTLRWEMAAGSLKEKRGMVRPIVDRVRARFNAATAEVDNMDDLTLATVAVIVVSNDTRHADSQMQTILHAIEGWRLDAVLAGVETEILQL